MKFDPLAVCAAAAFLVSAVTAYANDVANPKFDDVRDGVVAAWKIGEMNPPGEVPATGAVMTKRNVQISLGQTAEDGHFLHFASEGHALGDFGMVMSPPIRLVPGGTYEFSLKYRAKGLLMENADRTKLAALVADFMMKGGKNARLIGTNNSRGWTTLGTGFTAPDNVVAGGIHINVRNSYVGNPVSVDIRDVRVEPQDSALANAGFEADPQSPAGGWKALGGAKMAWAPGTAHSGKASASVSDAPSGGVSGWTAEIPVREDRLYSFDGWIKGGTLNSQGFLAGAVLQMQFLDNDGQPLGKPVISPAVSANTDWTHVATAKTRPPDGAVSAQLTCGLQFTNGTAWFDDTNVTADPVAAEEVAHVQRVPEPDAAVKYATNLLTNGDIESGADGKPAGWSYHGKSDTDWTPEELNRLYASGRPVFNIGRGEGIWSHDTAYAGKGALLNVGVDPPLSKNKQWYGRNPVDGYWVSDPMPCVPGGAYVAAGWIRPGKPITGAWFGPLHLLFYDKAGRELPVDTRSGMSSLPPGLWNFWATLPYVAPPDAVTMRLRFAQELAANAGGWGRTYADNLAVWQLPADAPIPAVLTTAGNTSRFMDWFATATATLKPPYLPSPADAPAYISISGQTVNTVSGNLFHDSQASVATKVLLANLLGEKRKLSLDITRYDWLGNAGTPTHLDGIEVGGYSNTTSDLQLPPTGSYGAFYLEIVVKEGAAVVGNLFGRYAVLPLLDRPRTAENMWGVTPLTPITGEDTPFYRELGEMIRTAGFGTAWVRMQYPANDDAGLAAAVAATQPILDWYHRYGLQSIVQLHPIVDRTLPYDAYTKAASVIAKDFKGKVRAFGNFGIEMANSASPFRGGGSARYGDDVYDSIVGAQYDGIKAATPDVPVFTGNVATDLDAKTLHRLYGEPCHGRLDGLVINTYLGIGSVIGSALKEFDAHAETKKDIWMEESAYQRSPYEGDARRYGEGDGAINMVRTWLGALGTYYPRLRIATMWGFNNRTDEDINMVTPRLQPRPLYPAFAVMANALADGTFVANRSSADISAFEWKRGDGPLLALWANAGDRDVTLQAGAGQVTLMDLMGNTQTLKAGANGIPLKLTATPVYVFNGGAISVVPPAATAANP